MSPVGETVASRDSRSAAELDLVRPRLRQDAIFLRGPDGIVARHGDESFFIKGRSAYSLLSVLAPHLNGERTLGEISNGLNEGQRAAVVSLVSMLFSRGLIMDYEPPAANVDVKVLERFAEQVSCLEHLGDRGARGFLRFREATVVVVGDQSLGAKVVASLAANGSSGARFVPAGDLDVTAGHSGSRALQGADLICFASLESDPRSGTSLAGFSERERVPFLPAWRLRDELIIGLLSDPRREPRQADRPCWRCVWLRLLDNGIAGADNFWAGVALGRSAAAPVRTAPEFSGDIAGGLLAFELFKQLSGVARSELDDALLVINLERCTTSKERPLVHPCCPNPGHRQSSDGATSADGVAGRQQDPLTIGIEYVGERTGVFTGFRDEQLRQIPIASAALEVPGLPRELTSDGLIYGFAASAMSDARADALYRAVARYSLHSFARTPHPVLDSLIEPPPSVRPDELVTWMGTSAGSTATSQTETVLAASLDASRTYRVPLLAAVASPVAGVTGYEPCLDGLAAASTFGEAVMRGLLGVAGLVEIKAFVRGLRQLASVPAADIEADERLRFFLAAAQSLECPVSVFELLGTRTVHVAVVLTGGLRPGRAVLGTGRSWVEACENALLEACGWAQLSNDGVAAPPPGMTSLLDALDWSEVAIAQTREGRRSAAAATQEDIERHLASMTVEPLVVDMTPADLRRAGPLRTVRILLRECTGNPASREQ